MDVRTLMRPPLEVTINGPRGDEWERVCGTRRFPVTTWEPIKATVMDEPAEVWLLNLLAIDKEMLAKIINHLALKFGTSVEEMAAQTAKQGIPILAKDCYVALNDPQRWCS